MKELLSVLRKDKNFLLYLLLFFLATEFAENYKWFTWAFPVLLLLVSLSRIRVLPQFNARCVLIILIFATYWLFSVNFFPAQEFIYHAFPTCLLFLIGRAAVKKNLDEFYLMGLLIIIPLCTCLYNIIYSIKDIITYGIVNLQLFVGNQFRYEEIRATSLIACELCSLIACLSLFFLSTKTLSLERLSKFGGYLAVIAAICAMHFVSRSALIVIFVTILIGIVSKTSLESSKSIFAVLVILVAGVLFFNSSIWDIYELKNAESDVLTGNGRLDRMEIWLDEIMVNPFGVKGVENERFMYAHNFWIDFAKTAGWIPGICMVLFSLLSVKDVVGVMRNKSLYPNIKWVVIALMTAYLLSFFVEPVFSGAKMGMFTYFFFCGVVSALSKARFK